MSDELDRLLRTTFAPADVAAAALDAAGGDVVKARKALGTKKSTPLDPALGHHVAALLAAARARGSLAKRNGGALSLLGAEVTRDLSALLYAGVHWCLSDVDLGGARLFATGATMPSPRVRGDALNATNVGTTADGAELGFRFGVARPWVSAPEAGEARTFESLDALLAELRADAARHGVRTDLDAPAPAPKKRAEAGPPLATPGANHRVYAGAEELAAELFNVDLYQRMMVGFLLRKKKKLPADDLWLVSREGALYRLSLASAPKAGSHVCWVKAVEPEPE